MENILQSEESYMSKRDVCSDAIPGTVSQSCTPGNTLCCVPNNGNAAASFPRCQQILGKGFCCVSNDNCYIDTVSDCTVENAVQCTLLAPGTTKACCPPFTFCPNNFNQSTSDVRCNLVQSSMTSTTSLSTSSSSSASTSPASTPSTSSASSLSIKPAPSSTTSSLPQPSLAASSKSLSGGAGAGIGIGVAAVVFGLVGLGIWLYRREKGKGEQRTTEHSSHLPPAQTQPSEMDNNSMVVKKPTCAQQDGLNQNSTYTNYELQGDGPQ